jgi:hypothetical protein
MLTVTCFLWHSPGSRYSAEDVRQLNRMVKKHLTLPHEFVCITDRPELFDLDSDIRAVQMDTSAHIPGRLFAKLWTFAPEAKEIVGKRILQLDLDCIIVGNIDAIVDRDEELVLWRNPARVPWENPAKNRALYNTSIVLHTAGSLPHYWGDFDPSRPMVRDDQAWISMLAGLSTPYWDASDGVYRIERDDTPGSGVGEVLPENARIVFCPGSQGKADNPAIRQKCPWIAEYA